MLSKKKKAARFCGGVHSDFASLDLFIVVHNTFFAPTSTKNLVSPSKQNQQQGDPAEIPPFLPLHSYHSILSGTSSRRNTTWTFFLLLLDASISTHREGAKARALCATGPQHPSMLCNEIPFSEARWRMSTQSCSIVFCLPYKCRIGSRIEKVTLRVCHGVGHCVGSSLVSRNLGCLVDCLFSFVCYSHGFGYIAIDTANGCIFSWIRSGVGSARSYVQGTLRALGKHRSWMLCEDPVSNSFEVFVCIPKIASQGRFVGVISITYYGYILRDAFGFPFRIDIGTNISIRAAQDEESTSSWFGQLLARWLSSVRQALRYDTG